MYSRGEYYPPEYYRRRGLAAKQRAAESADRRVKDAFNDVARHWLALAERVAWLERQQRKDSRNPITGTSSRIDDIPKHKDLGRLPTARREVPTSRTQSIHGKRTRPTAGHRDKVGSRSRPFSTTPSEFNKRLAHWR